MGFRFFPVTGWGQVAEMRGRNIGCAHPLAKSVARFANTSIHRLSFRLEDLRGYSSAH